MSRSYLVTRALVIVPTQKSAMKMLRYSGAAPRLVCILGNQLQNYIVDMHSSNEFSELKGIGDLIRKLVETKKDIVYPLVYVLVKLALILPVAIATVERTFSAMKFIKNRLRKRMGDQWLNDCLVTYIEKDVFDSVDNELIMQRFQNMKSCRGQLIATAGIASPSRSLLVRFDNRTLKAVTWEIIKDFRVPKPLPCGESCMGRLDNSDYSIQLGRNQFRGLVCHGSIEAKGGAWFSKSLLLQQNVS
ncbi:hypothetical protein ACSBR2_016076 [Camellia fascicularis]